MPKYHWEEWEELEFIQMGSFNNIRKRFPNAVKSTTNTFFLGTSPVITQKQLSYINEVVDKFFSQLIY